MVEQYLNIMSVQLDLYGTCIKHWQKYNTNLTSSLKQSVYKILFKQYIQPYKLHTVDSRYLEFQGTLWNTSRYPYFDISDLLNWGTNNSINYI